jgi:hypothetical protein
MSYAESVNSISDGICVTKQGSNMLLRRPVWEHSTLLRMLPKPINETEVEPYRLSADNYSYSDWIRAHRVAMFIGILRKVSFIDEVPGENPRIHPTPLSMLLRTLKAKPKGYKVDWEAYGNGSNAMQPIHKSKYSSFVQCVLLSHNGTNFYAEGSPQNNVVFMLPTSAKRGLEELLEEENPDFSGEPTDYLARFKYGHILDPEKGCAIKVVGAEESSATLSGSDKFDLGSTSMKSGGYVGSSSGNTVIKMYKVSVDATCPLPVKTIVKLWKPWDKVLWKMEKDKQVELLCTAFPTDIMKAAFEHTGLLPASLATGKTIHVPDAPEQEEVEEVPSTKPAEFVPGGFNLGGILPEEDKTEEAFTEATVAETDEVTALDKTSEAEVLAEIKRAKAAVEEESKE